MTSLCKKENGVYVMKVLAGDEVFGYDNNHNLTRNKKYIVKEQAYGEVLVENDLGKLEWYSHDWFRMNKI